MWSRILFPCFLALSALVAPVTIGSGGALRAQSADAQATYCGDSCFVHIDVNRYAVDEASLPRFAYEVPVGMPSGAGYDVELRYPEYQKLSGQELKAVRQLQKSGKLAEDSEIVKDGMVLLPEKSRTAGLGLDGHLAISRKRGIYCVSFSPVVLHQGQWKRILSCQIVVKPRDGEASSQRVKAAAAVNSAERWAEKSVLAEGKWAKIRVTQEGIYQLTQDDVRKMGLSSIDKVKVYGYGGLVQDELFSFPASNERTLQTTPPDDLVEVPTITTADGRRLFWAEGTVRYKWNNNSQRYTHSQNTYSKYSYYFVTEGDNPAKVQQLPSINSGEASTTVTTVPYVMVYDNDAFSWYHGGKIMFDSHDFSSGGAYSYKLASPGLSESGNKTVEVQMGASTLRDDTGFSIALNGNKLGNLKVDKYNADYSNSQAALFTYNRVSSLRADAANTFQFTPTSNNSARLDFIRINYLRELAVSAQPYSFSPQKSGTVSMQIAAANATSHVWRIGQVDSPTAEVPSTLGSDGVLTAVTSTPARRFVCFDERLAYASPEYVGSVDNQNLHGYPNVDYVIIVPSSGKLVAQAERLLEIHKQHNELTGCVVRADQLYNEFSSGTPDANAYRRFLKMMYDRAGKDEDAMPRYCLLMGKGSWDNRLITLGNKYSADDLLIAFEANASQVSLGSVYSYCTDDFFGFLDDGEGMSLAGDKLDIALGRMTCLTEDDAKRLVDKVETYINNTTVGNWKNTVAILGDNGESNRHMEDAESAANVITKVAPAFDVQRVYWDRYVRTSSATGFTYPQATDRIHNLMTEGALVFDYSGHGSPSSISKSQVLHTKDFQQAFSTCLPVWILASCEIYPYDSEEESLAEASLYLPNGGSIAFICATRSVYAPNNVTLNRALVNNLFAPNADGSYNSLGEALRLTKEYLVTSGTENTINKLKYILFGDPALHLALPKGRVVLDSINGKPVKSGDALVKLPAGGLVTFAGHVCQSSGNDAVDESFRGTVSATVYDCAETIVCKNNNGDNTNPYKFTERSKKVFQGSTVAEGGKFRFIFTVPRDITYSDKSGRLNLYAVTPDHSMEYSGHSETFCLNGTASTESDTIPPKVVLYINSIDNPDYTITDENPVLIADIFDENGINNAGIALGHDIELVLDDNYSDYINLKSYFNYDANSYQKGQIVYQLSNMDRGLHKASLRVWDVNNNYTISDVHFIVRSDYNTGMTTDGYITSTRNPASTVTNLITYFPQNAPEPGLVVYEVYDTRGRIVYKHSVSVDASARSSMLQWNLCGNSGQPLPDGLYFYRAVVNTADGRYETDAQKIIISR